jgi:hypothetical protein
METRTWRLDIYMEMDIDMGRLVSLLYKDDVLQEISKSY